VGRSAEENLRKIQEEDIPRIAAWARQTGSTFTTEKTELIHLTRRKKELGKGSVRMDGKTIQAGSTAKLLGVVFDQELRWKDHVQQVVKQATTATHGMSGLRHLRPAQMRQIYRAVVLPRLDFASTVWHDPLRDKGHYDCRARERGFPPTGRVRLSSRSSQFLAQSSPMRTWPD
jgi:hypothetical protein